eukprot:1153754-Pelagomonas_calceolata.AAC.1
MQGGHCQGAEGGRSFEGSQQRQQKEERSVYPVVQGCPRRPDRARRSCHQDWTKVALHHLPTRAAYLKPYSKATGKMKNRAAGEKKPTLAMQIAGVPEDLMKYMQGSLKYALPPPYTKKKEQVGVQLPENYYNIDNCVRKLNAMKSDAKKLLGNLKDTKPNSSGRALTAEELYDFEPASLPSYLSRPKFPLPLVTSHAMQEAERKLPWIKQYAQEFAGNPSYLPIPPIETQGGVHPPGTALEPPGENNVQDPFTRPFLNLEGDPSEATSPRGKGKGKGKASSSSHFLKPAAGTGSQLRLGSFGSPSLVLIYGQQHALMEKFMEEQAEKQQTKQETLLKDLFVTMLEMKKEEDAKAHERKKEEDAKAHERQMELMRMQQQFMAALFANNSQQQQQQQQQQQHSVTANQHPLALQAARQHPIMPHTALSPQLTPFPPTMGAQQSSQGGGYDTQFPVVPNSQPPL